MRILLIHFVVLTMLCRFQSEAIEAYHTSGITQMLADTAKKPTVSIEEATVKPFSVLAIRDTATSMEDISRVLGKGYGELFAFIGKNSLMPLRVMAFYYSYQPPIPVDITIEIGKMPASLSGRIFEKKIEGGRAYVAHYQGPYSLVEIAYTAIASKLKEEDNEANGQPFEVYLNSPGTVKDSNELRTDIYQLYKRILNH
ncbi:MAG: GyrI-like domain-containing protein [Chitinophagales bacterium]